MKSNLLLKSCFFYLFCMISMSLGAQEKVIRLNNPSFEDEPADATVPMGWFPCERGTTPDILPGFWGVYEEASEGETYMGLITRPNGSHESVTQRLSAPLVKDWCYNFSIDIAHSDVYADFNEPVKFRVYIGNSKCKKSQLIYESELIDFTEWETIKIDFKPNKKAKFILFEAYNPTKGKFPAGNVLLDNISPIRICSKV